MKKEKIQKIQRICEAETRLESFQLFYRDRELLRNWHIIFSGDNEQTKIPQVLHSQMITQDCYLGNLLMGNSIFLLSKDMVESMAKMKNETFSLDYSLSFDTQFTSYLKRTIYNSGNQVPSSFFKVIDYLIENNLNFDSLEYLYENISLIFSGNKAAKETLIAYEILKTIDLETYKKERKIKSQLSESNLNEIVDDELEEIRTNWNNDICTYVYEIYQLSYILLLKMVSIQFQHAKKGKEKRLKMLLDFMQNDLGKLCVRELIIADKYFEIENNLKYFKKIQRNSKNNIHNLKNMAWDLFHIHQMERNCCIVAEENSFFLPLFLTYDKGLIEIMELSSLSMIAYNKKENIILPIYKHIQCLDNILQDEKLQSYFLEETREERKINRNLNFIMKELEEEIKKF